VPSPSPPYWRCLHATGEAQQIGSAELAGPPRLHARDRPAPPGASHAGTASNGGPASATAPILVTKEHKLFIEFADAVRRERYVGLCFGAPGVGKTQSARTYANWDQLAPHLTGTRATGSSNTDATAEQVLAARAIMYTPQVHNTPRILDKEISFLHDRLGWNVELMLNPGRGMDEHGQLTSGMHAELVIVDEADRLKTAALEQLRDHHDRTGIGLILIGMPGIEKRLARYPQLYSRVGFVHHYKPMSADEQAFVLAKFWPHLHLGDTDDYATTEAIAAITRITNGNFRLTVRLIGQIERVMAINHMSTITKELVEARLSAHLKSISWAWALTVYARWIWRRTEPERSCSWNRYEGGT
jgi:DNA transposition AAA+ family ATPase